MEPLEEALQLYGVCYQQGWQEMMAKKLGLQKFTPASDLPLTAELETVLRLVETDMTIFYRQLAEVVPKQDQDDESLLAPLLDAYYQPQDLAATHKVQIIGWLRRYLQRAAEDGLEGEERRRRMNAVNPKYVLRNYLAQMAIDKSEAGDHSLVNELLEVMRRPYDEQTDKQEFSQKRPEWARHRAGCSMLSCSS